MLPALLEALADAFGQFLAVQISIDEDQLVHPGLTEFPRGVRPPFELHLYILEGELLRIPLPDQHALHAEDVFFRSIDFGSLMWSGRGPILGIIRSSLRDRFKLAVFEDGGVL